MDSYAITFHDNDGNERTVEGGTLECLQQQLAEAGYDGASIRVTNAPGFTVGWVSTTSWRHA